MDTNPLGNGYYTYKQRKFAIWAFCFGFIVLWLSMVVIGTFIRGPGWIWFWPGQTWDHNKLIFEANRDLPDMFGITSMLGKSLFGAAVVGLFAVVTALGVHKLFTWNAFNRENLPSNELDSVPPPAVFPGHHDALAGQDGGATAFSDQVRVGYSLVQYLAASG